MPGFTLVAVGAGVASAMLYSSLLLGAPGALIFAYLAHLPLFAVGLWVGVGGVLIASLAGTVFVAVVGSAMLAGFFAVLNAAPAILLSRQALLNRARPDGSTEWYPPGKLVLTLASLAAGAFIGLMAYVGPQQIEDTLAEFLRRGLTNMMADAPSSDRVATMARQIAHFFPGIVAASWMVMVAVNGALAQGLLVRFGRNARPSLAVADIELPIWLAGAAAIAALGAQLPSFSSFVGFVGTNLLVVAIVAYVFAGLAVVHTFARRWSASAFWLIAVYVLMITLGWPIVLVAGLGFIEPWAKLRQRFAGGPPQNSG
ncbi:MAG: DUF2232 domain-containing protein [Rhodospirillales bacterium]|nr:DUF2232 domain-containing protein [Rhodospirillales bacterium]